MFCPMILQIEARHFASPAGDDYSLMGQSEFPIRD
jgi:hypothetical protein